jgi:Tripartite tricarboxylate transporter family receptor
MAMLARAANIQLQHVPFRGGPQALTEVLAKRIDLIVDAPVILTEHLGTGSIRALAVTTRERSSWLPDTPSVAENGFADFDVRGWMGLVAPAGLSGTIASRLNAELTSVLADIDVKQRVRALGTEAAPPARQSSGRGLPQISTVGPRWSRKRESSASESDNVCLRTFAIGAYVRRHRRQRRSVRIARAALWPGAPVTPPPGCAPAPQW